ncbi:hypothetical protein Leryth_013645 [Lithospermum erythrorhizon]|nr:hypothetical protein Leryth_013645 [Lithospermum erythrorhizon]
MQHMNFDTELINHFSREKKKMPNDFSHGGSLKLMYDQINHGNRKLVGNTQRRSRITDYEALDEMTMHQAQVKTKALVDDIITGENCSRRNGVSLEPTQFTDALEILKLKRSLFLQRVQLSRKDCESLELFLDSGSVDIQGSCNSGAPKFLESNNDPQNTHSLKNYPILRPQGNIVILRPAPKVMESPKHVICNCSSLSSHQRPKGKVRKVKNSYFCLKEIKNRLKCALRNNHEKQQMTSLSGPPSMKRINMGGGYKVSPNFDTAKPHGSFDKAKARDKLHEQEFSRVRKGCESPPSNKTGFGKLKLSDDSHTKCPEPDIFQEAKKHLSERLKNVNDSTVDENCRTPKTLGRILCSPEHDFSVPLNLKWKIKYLSVMTESPPPPTLTVKNDQKLDDNYPVISDVNDLRIQEDTTEKINYPNVENSWMGNSLKDPALLATTSSINQETGSLYSPSPSSSSTYSPQKVGSIEYGDEYQSPVSVLDPLFMEDANTPKGSAAGPLQPLRLAFEDYDYMNEDEAIREYVRAVLQAAGFNWNNYFQSRPTHDEILNISFPYGDILLEIKMDNDPQLLVDFVNDVLLEIYQQHFGCNIWTSSYIKPNTRSHLLEQHFINQVVEEVKGAMFPDLLHPTLDQLVGTDIGKSSSSWLDIRVDVEDLVNTITEDILQESIDGISIMLSS